MENASIGTLQRIHSSRIILETDNNKVLQNNNGSKWKIQQNKLIHDDASSWIIVIVVDNQRLNMLFFIQRGYYVCSQFMVQVMKTDLAMCVCVCVCDYVIDTILCVRQEFRIQLVSLIFK